MINLSSLLCGSVWNILSLLSRNFTTSVIFVSCLGIVSRSEVKLELCFSLSPVITLCMWIVKPLWIQNSQGIYLFSLWFVLTLTIFPTSTYLKLDSSRFLHSITSYQACGNVGNILQLWATVRQHHADQTVTDYSLYEMKQKGPSCTALRAWITSKNLRNLSS